MSIFHSLTQSSLSGVKTIHLYGVNVDTAKSFRYADDDDFDKQPETINGNGMVLLLDTNSAFYLSLIPFFRRWDSKFDQPAKPWITMEQH